MLESEFNQIQVYDALDLQLPVAHQTGVELVYTTDMGVDIPASLCHGITLLFDTDDGCYCLGIPGQNTDPDASESLELQAAIGDNVQLEHSEESILDTLNTMMNKETAGVWSLQDFDLQREYVVNRVSRWSLNYLKVVGRYIDVISLEGLIARVREINIHRGEDTTHFGVYLFEDIVEASCVSAPKPEGEKIEREFKNWVTDEIEHYVVLDDQSTMILFEPGVGPLSYCFEKSVSFAP